MNASARLEVFLDEKAWYAGEVIDYDRGATDIDCIHVKFDDGTFEYIYAHMSLYALHVQKDITY